MLRAAAIAILAAGGLYALWPDAPRPFVPGAVADQGDARPAVGDLVAPSDLHHVTAPGRYGLGPHLSGSRYGIASGHLIRFNPETGQVQSVLRRQSDILD